MNDSTIEDLARRLREAAASGQPCKPVRHDLKPGDVISAYAIQRTNVDYRIARGARPVGRKIGLTSESVQRQIGIDQPDYGVIFAEDVLADGATIFLSSLMQARIEAEIVFVLERDLAQAEPSLADVVGAISYALPAFEIVCSRIADWDIGLQDTIADNASLGCVILGAMPQALGGLDLELCGMQLRDSHGTSLSMGLGAACLGNPLHAVAWLARRMVEVGMPLVAGDIVLSGALGPFVPIAAGESYEGRIGGLGSVRVNVSE